MNFRKVIVTPRAAGHLNSLHTYISAQASEDRASDYIARISAFCASLSAFPFRGMQRDDIFSGLRVTGFERRVTIASVVTDTSVLIEGVFYGGRDLTKALTDKR